MRSSFRTYISRTAMLAFMLIFPCDAAWCATQLSDHGFSLLKERIELGGKRFFIYRNADAGSNHGVASGLSGATRKIHINAACVDDTSVPAGCARDPAKFDRGKGNVLAITFDPLARGEYAAVTIEEPANWGLRRQGRGYDLRGAVNLIFETRSPTPGGLTAQFGLGGKLSAFMHVAQSETFNVITIPISSLGLDDSELADTHALFSIATNDNHAPSGGVVLLDNIRLAPAPGKRAGIPRLPQSTETFGIVPVTAKLAGRVSIPPDQVNRNIATTYESSLAALALLGRNTEQDRELARLLLDSLSYALHHDNAGDPLPSGRHGGLGLHDGYMSGDLPLYNRAEGSSGAEAGDARLAGYSAPHCGPSGFCTILDGATGGNNAFAILAFLGGYRAFGEERYLEDARTIARWISGNLKDEEGFGGYFFGYPDEGVTPKTLIRGKSTENMADIFAAFTSLALVEETLGRGEDAERLRVSANAAGDFVVAMHDATSGCFHTGAVPAGTPPAPGVEPDGEVRGSDVVNRARLFDATSFAILAMAGSPRYREALDWTRAASCMEETFRRAITAGGRKFEGYGIAGKELSGPAGIAWEFTGQAVVVFDMMRHLTGAASWTEKAGHYVKEMVKAKLYAPFGDGHGLVAATLQDGELLPPREHCLSTPFQCIPARVGLAASIWAIFADARLNPFNLQRKPPSKESGQ